jgi:hypothetical protein
MQRFQDSKSMRKYKDASQEAIMIIITKNQFSEAIVKEFGI